MALINRTDIYHLYYLLVNNIRKDWYEGLSHVAEHTLLAPADTGKPFIGRGYTSMSHVCLCFESKSLEVLQEIDEKIMREDIITNNNVKCAKKQVIQEIMNQYSETVKFEELINFVTENRVRSSVIGSPKEIKSIQRNDICRWVEEKQCDKKIYRFLFRDAHNMIFSTDITSVNHFSETERVICNNPANKDSYLYRERHSNYKIIQAYIKIPSLFTKKDVIKKAFYEFCVQKKVMDSLKIELIMSDVFFGVDERFILVEIAGNSAFEVENVIQMIRMEISSISLKEFTKYKTEFINYIYGIMNKGESNFEIMNAIKDFIVYAKPQIHLEDVNMIIFDEWLISPREWIESMPLKVVIL